MRALLAAMILMGLVPQAQATEVRNFFAPEIRGERIGACLADGACGKPAADAFCRSEGFDHAVIFQRETIASTRILDSGRECTGDCTSFRQVKCFTVKGDLETGNTAL